MTELAKAKLLNNWFFRGTVSHWFLFSSFSSHGCNHQSDHMCVTPWDFNWSRSKIQCLLEESEVGRWNTTPVHHRVRRAVRRYRPWNRERKCIHLGVTTGCPQVRELGQPQGYAITLLSCSACSYFILFFFPKQSFCLMQCFRSVNNCVYTAGFM